jgi:hypothetical protein
VATSVQIAAPARTRGPLALWHLLSLDAPSVAALWTWFLARACQVRLPSASTAAMALAVWMLYAADRLLDARQLDSQARRPPAGLEERHVFHHRHRPAFLFGIGVAAILLATLLPRLDIAAIHLYLTEGALLFAWFLILHATHSAHRLPKEIAVGLFFAAAVFIPTVARAPALRIALLPSAALLTALCGLNCLYIYAWEHPPGSAGSIQTAHPSTRLALRYLAPVAATAAVAGLALAALAVARPESHSLWPIPVAAAFAAILLIALDRIRYRLAPVTLRAAADLALLTPIALIPFLR